MLVLICIRQQPKFALMGHGPSVPPILASMSVLAVQPRRFTSLQAVERFSTTSQDTPFRLF